MEIIFHVNVQNIYPNVQLLSPEKRQDAKVRFLWVLCRYEFNLLFNWLCLFFCACVFVTDNSRTFLSLEIWFMKFYAFFRPQKCLMCISFFSLFLWFFYTSIHTFCSVFLKFILIANKHLIWYIFGNFQFVRLMLKLEALEIYQIATVTGLFILKNDFKKMQKIGSVV